MRPWPQFGHRPRSPRSTARPEVTFPRPTGPGDDENSDARVDDAGVDDAGVGMGGQLLGWRRPPLSFMSFPHAAIATLMGEWLA